MKTVQPPITNDQELAGYRAAADKLERLMQRHEDDLMAERNTASADTHKVNQIRYTLARLYAYHQGIQAAIAAYLAGHQRTA
jgi:hypothetical protein